MSYSSLSPPPGDGPPPSYGPPPGLPDGDWPGEDAVAADAEDGCVDELFEYSPAAYDDQQVDIYYLLPTRATWRSGDREVVCITYYLDGPRAGSVREQP